MKQDIPLLSILGPTASGKTSIALEIAEKINGEIISCDSMQVYRGMDIGTAKASLEERQAIPHHIIDILDISEYFSAARFVDRAKEVIADIHARGKKPILVGGTGLYARLLLYGGCMLPADREIAKKIREEFAEVGLAPLQEELAKIDPAGAEIIGDNQRKVFRALEAVRISKKPLPGKVDWGDELQWPGRQIILIPSADKSRELIRQRTAEMLENGWIEETEKLLNQGLMQTPTALQSLGYREIAGYLKGEFATKEDLLEKLITLTCRYAKRQRTWFRNQHKGAEIFSDISAESKKALIQSIVESYS